MGDIAYTVRKEYADGFQGGALAVNDETYHLGEALKKGHGYVVVSEQETGLVLRLDEQPALVRCAVSEARKASKTTKKDGGD